MAGVALVVALWCAPGAWARATYGARTTADEPQYLLSAISLAEDHNLDVSDERAAGRYRAFHEVGLPLQEELRADGSRVSPHDPGLPALLAIPTVLGGWLGAKLALAALGGALAAAMLWVAVRRFDVGLSVAVVTVLAFSLAAPLVIYSTQVYPEIAAALVVTVGLAAATGGLHRRGILVLAGAVIALPWLSVKYAPVAAVLATIGIVRTARRGEGSRALGLVVVLAAAAAAFAVAHQAWYGGFTPYASGRHFTGGEVTVMGSDPDYAGRSVRLLGLLVDRDFGLAAWAPGYLLVVPALAAGLRRRPPGGVAVTSVLGTGWALATFAALTMHGWWWPGRHVVAVLPAAVVAVAWWADRVPAARAAVIATGAIGAVTAAWVVVDVLSGHMTLIVDFDRTTNPLRGAWSVLLPDGRASTSATAVLRGVWFAALGLLAVAGWCSAGAPPRSPSRPRRPRWPEPAITTAGCHPRNRTPEIRREELACPGA